MWLMSQLRCRSSFNASSSRKLITGSSSRTPALRNRFVDARLGTDKAPFRCLKQLKPICSMAYRTMQRQWILWGEGKLPTSVVLAWPQSGTPAGPVAREIPVSDPSRFFYEASLSGSSSANGLKIRRRSRRQSLLRNSKPAIRLCSFTAFQIVTTWRRIGA